MMTCLFDRFQISQNQISQGILGNLKLGNLNRLISLRNSVKFPKGYFCLGNLESSVLTRTYLNFPNFPL